MARVDFFAVTKPVGILRAVAALLTCMTFSLAAAEVSVPSSYWVWCIFSWTFCFFFTFLILILEFTTFNTKVPLVWDDFTAAFPMLATLMCFAASIIYPIFFACQSRHRAIGASVLSWLCFGVYVGEVILTCCQPRGQTKGFLSTIPGIMKMLETFLACFIFISLDSVDHPGLRWCVAVYSLCFIFTILIILFSIQTLTSLPILFDKLVVVYNILAALMYLTAMVIWPVYTFRNNSKSIQPHTTICATPDKRMVITVMTILNFLVYTLDSAYSIRLVFFTRTSGTEH